MSTKFRREELKEMTVNPNVLSDSYDAQLLLASHRKELARLEGIVRTLERDLKTTLLKAHDLGITEEVSEEHEKLILNVEYKEVAGKQVRSRLWVSKG